VLRSSERFWRIARLGCCVDRIGCGASQLGCGVCQINRGVVQAGCSVALLGAVRRCSDSITASAGWPEFDSRRKPSGGKELSENKCVMYNCVDERSDQFFNKINKQMAERHL
jgi:hypothetical protein